MQASPYIQQPHHGVGHPGQSHVYKYQHPNPHGPGYVWPPSPVSTPPYHPYSPMHGYPPGPPEHHHSPYTAPMHSMMPAYERSNSMSDRPLSHPRGMSSATAAQQGFAPPYNPTSSTAALQARIIAEQAQIAQQALRSGTVLDPRITSPGATLPPVKIPEVRPTTPPQAQQNGNTAKADSPTSANGKTSSSPRNGETTTKSTSIPSISHLVHASDSNGTTNEISVPTGERSGSKSPTTGDKLKDLLPPIGGSDQRAIRALDRKFMI